MVKIRESWEKDRNLGWITGGGGLTYKRTHTQAHTCVSLEGQHWALKLPNQPTLTVIFSFILFFVDVHESFLVQLSEDQETQTGSSWTSNQAASQNNSWARWQSLLNLQNHPLSLDAPCWAPDSQILWLFTVTGMKFSLWLSPAGMSLSLFSRVHCWPHCHLIWLVNHKNYNAGNVAVVWPKCGCSVTVQTNTALKSAKWVLC